MLTMSAQLLTDSQSELTTGQRPIKKKKKYEKNSAKKCIANDQKNNLHRCKIRKEPA